MLRYIESKDGKMEGHLITLLPGKEVETVKAVINAASDLQPGDQKQPVGMGLLISDADVRVLCEDGSTEIFFAHMLFHLKESGIIGLGEE